MTAPPSAGTAFEDRLENLAAHERVEAGRGIVQEQDLRPPGHGEKQSDLGSGPSRERSDARPRIEVEPLPE